MQGIDIVGDIHGQFEVLAGLGRALGYDVNRDWGHPHGRVLLFLGDLVDRGDASLEVVELVERLVRSRQALCLMGNHEYNLVAHYLGVPGYEQPKHSNRTTIDRLNREPARRDRAVDFLAALPVVVDLPDLRVVHACWHADLIELLRPLLPVSPPRFGDGVGWLEQHVVLGSPFEGNRLRSGLPGDTADADAEVPHEVLMKGPELSSPAFHDADGKLRDRQRALWWRDSRVPVPSDKTIVFGHYWNLPPISGVFVPPHASGTRELRDWTVSRAPAVPAFGRVSLSGRFVCVDFNGVLLAGRPPVLGALRWPEREVVWAG